MQTCESTVNSVAGVHRTWLESVGTVPVASQPPRSLCQWVAFGHYKRMLLFCALTNHQSRTWMWQLYIVFHLIVVFSESVKCVLCVVRSRRWAALRLGRSSAWRDITGSAVGEYQCSSETTVGPRCRPWSWDDVGGRNAVRGSDQPLSRAAARAYRQAEEAMVGAGSKG